MKNILQKERYLEFLKNFVSTTTCITKGLDILLTIATIICNKSSLKKILNTDLGQLYEKLTNKR